MRKLFVLGICFGLAAVAYAGNTGPVDLTNPETGPLPPPAGGGVCAAQEVTAHVEATGGAVLQYAALVGDYNGVNNYFIKLQAQSSAMFNYGGFYTANNGPGFGPGFFALTQPFASGDMKVEHDGAGKVTLTLSNLLPAQPDQIYEGTGYPVQNGDGYGYAGYSGNSAVDDFGIMGQVCDDFNRADGPLGPDWDVLNGTCTIVSQTARGNGMGRAIFIGECGGDTGCEYEVKKDSKAKKGCLKCYVKGDKIMSGDPCEKVKDCDRKIKEKTYECLDPVGIGFCKKLKAKRSDCIE